MRATILTIAAAALLALATAGSASATANRHASCMGLGDSYGPGQIMHDYGVQARDSAGRHSDYSTSFYAHERKQISNPPGAYVRAHAQLHTGDPYACFAE
jgi:hypothetical protein